MLRRAFSLIPEYLQTAADPRAVNLMDYGVSLGRRFRALKLWFVLRSFGREGLAAVIRSHVAMAQEFAAGVDADPCFERMAPAPFSVVNFRFNGSDDENRAILDRVNATGEVFLSGTYLHGHHDAPRHRQSRDSAGARRARLGNRAARGGTELGRE